MLDAPWLIGAERVSVPDPISFFLHVGLMSQELVVSVVKKKQDEELLRAYTYIVFFFFFFAALLLSISFFNQRQS